MKALVSVIVPVYNAEEYLCRGIDSLLNQTYDNIEIILVDDVSTDDSWSICQDYAKKNKEKVRIFRNDKNSGGPLRGRELGIKEAIGEWITFMDCDDFVAPEYIDNLVNTTDGGRYDVAVTGYQKYFNDGSTERFFWNDYTQTTEERMKTFYQHLLTNNFWTDPADTVGQNLVRADVAKKADLSNYSDNIWAEDTLMALVFLANSKKGVNFVDKHDFYWRQRQGSGSHGGFSSRADKKSFFRACMEIFHTEEIYKNISRTLPLVSVVIPVYNVEDYLAECLESVTSQSYENIEIICVNDGSLDNSEKIIDEYIKNDKRIIKISKQNEGLNAARKSGSSVARGVYIMFVDSDDMIDENCIRHLYEAIQSGGADIAVGGYKTFSSKNELSNSDDREERCTKAEDSDAAVDWLLTGNLNNIIIGNDYVLRMTAWGKLYRSEIIHKTDWIFSDYQTNEDEFEQAQWFNMAKRGVTTTTHPVYYYRQNPASKTRKRYSNKDQDGEVLTRFEFAERWRNQIKHYLNNYKYIDKIDQRFLWLIQDGVARAITENNLGSEAHSLKCVIRRFQESKESEYRNKIIELERLRRSKSWRITMPLRKLVNTKAFKMFKKASNAIRHPKRFAREMWDKKDKLIAQKKYKNAWVISDRVDQASDNGIILYNFLREKHSDVNVFYVISKDSSDFGVLKTQGVRLVDHNSKEHRMLMRNADVELSAFFNFAPFDINALGRTRPLKRAFILHGMDQSDLSLHYSRLAVDLYCTVTKDSYDFYKEGKSLIDISNKNLCITGMPRYDLARKKMSETNIEEERNKIIIAPTWRRFLLYKPGTTEKVPEDYLKKSNYYKNYTSLFNSVELKELSKKYEIILIPHPELLLRIGEFNIPNYIKIKTYKDLGTERLYDLALATDLFISDFSSTVFDFAFLGANVVYFNFDEEDYYSDKQELYRSWFNIERDGFGPHFKTVNLLRCYLSQGKWIRYQKNVEKVWRQVPENSSESIYQSVNKILGRDNEQ